MYLSISSIRASLANSISWTFTMEILTFYNLEKIQISLKIFIENVHGFMNLNRNVGEIKSYLNIKQGSLNLLVANIQIKLVCYQNKPGAACFREEVRFEFWVGGGMPLSINRRKSLICTVRTSRQRLRNQKFSW